MLVKLLEHYKQVSNEVGVGPGEQAQENCKGRSFANVRDNGKCHYESSKRLLKHGDGVAWDDSSETEHEIKTL